ncbi:unnamed protein product [Rotaria sordida]|uniref:Cyclic nucleotide-binding domain-containing protein n=1 Tax=Rotaria sordida TaxID=392033 RepID=A0A814KVT1_9BILA|nr:unnamed protein product [Rotaria sordida]CAF1090541.1 unnamed protein product [Rotaria sordida]CAF1150894.1 unnamed protein product [Rotaria sordida]CAF1175695.1 unnamed protein product [Rotaria sordida]CAF1389817.1 unnamed protein product [Rotaria sordida]
MDDLKEHENQMDVFRQEIPIELRKQFENDDDEVTELGEWAYSLQFVQIFQHLNNVDRLDLSNQFVFEEFNDKDIIINESEDAKFFYIILQGAAMVYKTTSNNGSRVKITKLGPYDHFGGLSLFFHKPYAATVQAIGPLKCLKMDDKKFQTNLQPKLIDLERAAQQYNAFINFPV